MTEGGWVVAVVILLFTVFEGFWLSFRSKYEGQSMQCFGLAILLSFAGVCLDFTTTYVGQIFFTLRELNINVVGLMNGGWWLWLAVDMTIFSMLLLISLLVRLFIYKSDVVYFMVIFPAWVKLAMAGANVMLILAQM